MKGQAAPASLRLLGVSLGVMWALTVCHAQAGDALAHLGAGLKLFDQQRYSEAAKEFNQALAADPKLDDARYHLAVCEFNQRDYPAALKEFETLASSPYRPRWVTYYLARLDLLDGKLDSSIRRFDSPGGGEPLADELYYLGSAWVKKGEARRAIAPLEGQLHFNPRDFRAHSLLARAYAWLGRAQDAEREFEESERLHRYYLEGKQELVACRSKLAAGKESEAWAQCGSAVQGDDVDKLVGVGMLFGEFRSFSHALEAFQRAVELDPESPEINYNLGLTYYQKEDYPKARQFLEVALEARPEFFEALEVYGAALHQLRSDAAARAALERAHRLRPDDEAVNQLLSQLESAHPR